MQQRVRKLVWLLMLALAVTLLPPLPVYASGSLSLIGLQVRDANLNSYFLGAELIAPRNLTWVDVALNARLDESTVHGRVRVLDAQGTPLGWQVEVNASGHPRLLPPRVLERGAYYQIHIKGGPGGVRAMDGSTLPEDLWLHFQAENKQVRVSTFLQHPGVPGQVHGYLFQAEPGLMNLRPIGIGEAETDQFVLLEPQTKEELGWATVGPDAGELLVELPYAGEYLLIWLPASSGEVYIEAPELRVDPVLPVLHLPRLPYLATLSEPITITAQTDGAAVSGVVMQHGERTPMEIQNGRFPAFTLNPADYQDGLHTVHFFALNDSRSYTRQSLHFLVDGQDSFPDVPRSHWARRHVEIMYHMGVVGGRPDGRFAPGAPVLRSEFVKMLALSLGIEASPGVQLPFADVAPTDWFYPYVAALYEYGLVQGVREGDTMYFHPSRTISRAEAATLIARSQGVPTEISLTAGFLDFNQVPSWARSSVAALSHWGWLSGYPDGNFYPTYNLNRDQSAKVLANLFGVE